MSARFVAVMALATLGACKQDYEVVDLVGQDGELRFNLVFTNETNVDLDLHVTTPAGDEIYWQQKTDTTGGELDVDCYCSDCTEGANENVFWRYGGEAAAGDYLVDVQFYGGCGIYTAYDPYEYYYYADPQDSDYTLRIVENGDVMATYEGTLGDYGESDPYTYTFTP